MITHGHIDHAGGAAELKERLGVPIEGPHEGDRSCSMRWTEQGRPRHGGGPPGDARQVASGRRHGHDRGPQVRGAALSRPLAGIGRARQPAATLCACGRRVVSGLDRSHGSAGRRSRPLIHAIRTKLLPLGDEFAFICGHGPTSTFGASGAATRSSPRMPTRSTLSGSVPRPVRQPSTPHSSGCAGADGAPLSMTASQMSTSGPAASPSSSCGNRPRCRAAGAPDGLSRCRATAP